MSETKVLERTLAARLAPDFDRIAPLGAGGMGAVFRARQVALDREVAIKVLHAMDEISRRRFEREAQVLVRLRHPGILPVIAADEIPEGPYLVTELIEGRTLREIAAGGLKLQQALDILREILEAVGHAHREGIVHRDLKPENVLVQDDGRVVVIDFGIARAIAAGDTVTQAGVIQGTPAYIAPEQLGGSAAPSVDQYAIATIAFELFAGERPFSGEDAMRVLRRKLDGPAPPLATRRPDLPARILSAVDRALDRDPARRFPDCERFARALETGADRGGARPRATVVATPVQPTVIVPPPRTGSYGLLATVILVTSIAVVLVRRPDPPPPAPSPPPVVSPSPSAALEERLRRLALDPVERFPAGLAGWMKLCDQLVADGIHERHSSEYWPLLTKPIDTVVLDALEREADPRVLEDAVRLMKRLRSEGARSFRTADPVFDMFAIVAADRIELRLARERLHGAGLTGRAELDALCQEKARAMLAARRRIASVVFRQLSPAERCLLDLRLVRKACHDVLSGLPNLDGHLVTTSGLYDELCDVLLEVVETYVTLPSPPEVADGDFIEMTTHLLGHAARHAKDGRLARCLDSLALLEPLARRPDRSTDPSELKKLPRFHREISSLPQRDTLDTTARRGLERVGAYIAEIEGRRR